MTQEAEGNGDGSISIGITATNNTNSNSNSNINNINITNITNPIGTSTIARRNVHATDNGRSHNIGSSNAGITTSNSSNATVTTNNTNNRTTNHRQQHPHSHSHVGEQKRSGPQTTAQTSLLVAIHMIYIAKYALELRTSSANEAWHAHVTLILSLVAMAVTFQPERAEQVVQAASSLLFESRNTGASLLSRIRSVSSANALASLARASSVESLSRMSCTFRKSFGNKTTSRRRWNGRASSAEAITSSQCFVPLSSIAKLSLGDISVIFEYCKEISGGGGGGGPNRRAEYLKGKPELIQIIADSIDEVVKTSIENETAWSLSLPTAGTATDAHGATKSERDSSVGILSFIAAVRLYAEWRNVRISSCGNPGYAAAMKLGRHDMIRNLEKIERGVHRYLKLQFKQQQQQQTTNQPGQGTISTPTTIYALTKLPTMREILMHELDSSIHPRLPRLTDASAANGLLWTLRQLNYQTKFFANMKLVPVQYLTANDVALAAYTEVYEKYHRWTTRQIFQHTVGASPPLNTIMTAIVKDGIIFDSSASSHQGMGPAVSAAMNPSDNHHTHDDGDTTSDGSGMTSESHNSIMQQQHDSRDKNGPFRMMNAPLPSCLPSTSSSVPSEAFPIDRKMSDVSESTSQTSESSNRTTLSFDHMIKTIEKEWNKATSFLDKLQCGGTVEDEKKTNFILKAASSTTNIINSSHHDLMDESKKEIDAYLKFMEPLLKNVEHLFDELHMNDPTKV